MGGCLGESSARVCLLFQQLYGTDHQHKPNTFPRRSSSKRSTRSSCFPQSTVPYPPLIRSSTELNNEADYRYRVSGVFVRRPDKGTSLDRETPAPFTCVYGPSYRVKQSHRISDRRISPRKRLCGLRASPQERPDIQHLPARRHPITNYDVGLTQRPLSTMYPHITLPT